MTIDQSVERQAAQQCMQRELLDALQMAYEAMNYMGDVLNGMDAVMPEDVEKTGPAFEKVRDVLARAGGQP